MLMVSCCGQSVSVIGRCAASTIALKAYSSYTPRPIDSILGRKHQGDLSVLALTVKFRKSQDFLILTSGSLGNQIVSLTSYI